MKRLAPLGWLLAAACGAAVAQEPAPAGPLPATPPEDIGKPIGSPDAGFESLDGNGDRRLSRAEVKASLELTARFAEFDADGDGYLSRDEYAAFGREPPRTRPAR